MSSKYIYASDWVDVGAGVEYSPTENLWFKDGTIYDELSARHNGICGIGAALKSVISTINQEK